MPRPPKRGLEYFGKDVDFYEDFKIIDLLSEHGPVGVVIYDFLLTQIYKNGYYLELPIDKAALLAVRAIGSRWLKKDQAINVIHYCGDIGLFRVDLLDAGVFTSASIQKRYAVVTSKRVINRKKYWVLDAENQEKEEKCTEPVLNAPFFRVSEEETPVSGAETPVSDAEMRQKEKEKEKKEKKEKEKEMSNPATASVFQTFEDCGFRISAHASERLLSMCDTYSPHWVEEAIKRATDRGKKNLAYIEGILRSWNSAGAMDDRRKEQYAEYSGNHGETGDAFDPFAGEEIL